MLYVAFALTALAGIFLGVWLAAHAAVSQTPSSNPAKVWAFVDVLKHRTIEAYSVELASAIRLKYPDGATVSAEQMANFIDEYTKSVLEHQTTRR